MSEAPARPPSSAPLARGTALRAGLWLSLGGWIGAWGFFAFVVSRLAFRVLPGDLAGDVAGALLHSLHLGGAVAGLAVAACGFGLGYRGWAVSLPVVLGLVSLASELFLSPEVAALRPSTLGPANTEASQTRFRVLHGISLGLFMVIHLASIVLSARFAWLETRNAHAANPPWETDGKHAKLR